MDGLAVDMQRLDALGHHRLGLHLAAVDHTPPSRPARCPSPPQVAPISPRRIPAAGPRSARRAWSSSGSARSDGRRSPHRGIRPRRQSWTTVDLEDAGSRIATDLRCDHIGDRRLEGLVMHRERPVPHQAASQSRDDAFRVHDERPTDVGRGSSAQSPARHSRTSVAVPCTMVLRSDAQGLPSRSHEARLYRMRRLAGHEQAHFG